MVPRQGVGGLVDDADRAQEVIEASLAKALARRRPVEGLAAAGACHYCAEAVGGGRLFCDSECEGEWQRERHLRALRYGTR
jgi:hypothetical protein